MAAWDRLRQLLPGLLKVTKKEFPRGQTMISSAGNKPTTLVMRSRSVYAPMTVDKAKEIIFDRLCKEYKARGAGAGLERETLRKELAIPEELFHWALTEMTSGEGSLFVDRDHLGKRISLGMRGQLRCKEGINPFASGEAAKK